MPPVSAVEGRRVYASREPVTLLISRGKPVCFLTRREGESSRQLETWYGGPIDKMGWLDSLEWLLGGR